MRSAIFWARDGPMPSTSVRKARWEPSRPTRLGDFGGDHGRESIEDAIGATIVDAELSDEDKQKLSDRIPMQKLGQPQDVADAVLFLASPMADYVTGQVLTVDGGLARLRQL